jgi:hypothetical protein
VVVVRADLDNLPPAGLTIERETPPRACDDAAPESYRSAACATEAPTETLTVRCHFGSEAPTLGGLVVIFLFCSGLILIQPVVGLVGVLLALMASTVLIRGVKETAVVVSEGMLTVDGGAPLDLSCVQSLHLNGRSESHQIEAEMSDGKMELVLAGIRAVDQARFLANLIADEVDKAKAVVSDR